MIRRQGVCNGNPETTVSCHLRMPGVSGFGYIADPIFIAFGCSDCHQWSDTHHDPESLVDFYRGIFRTQQWLYKNGYIEVSA